MSAYFFSPDRGPMTPPIGKTLKALAYDVNVLRHAARTTFESKASICWQGDGTLCYFDAEDGYPGFYFAPHTDFANNKEDFASLERFIAFIEKYSSGETMQFLLSAPVWYSFDPDASIKAFNALLGDMEVDL